MQVATCWHLYTPLYKCRLCSPGCTCQDANTGDMLGWMTAPESRSFAPDLPLKFVGGDPSVDFVNTVDWTPDGLVNERLVDFRRLLEWGKRAGVIDRGEAARLARVAGGRPRAAQKAYGQARWGRWVLQRLFTSVAARHPSSAVLEEFNDLRRLASGHLALVFADRTSERADWRANRADDLDLILSKVVRSAETLLTSGEAARLRVCAGPDCGWIYVDRSRNGLRRWCEMQTCGTQAKSLRRAARREAARTPTTR
jgi:predicted RNA-binding Zn ribbon-like protein